MPKQRKRCKWNRLHGPRCKTRPQYRWCDMTEGPDGLKGPGNGARRRFPARQNLKRTGALHKSDDKRRRR